MWYLLELAWARKDIFGSTAFDAMSEQAEAKWTTKGDEIKEDTTNKIPPEINDKKNEEQENLYSFSK
jgi:hypothetical protein